MTLRSTEYLLCLIRTKDGLDLRSFQTVYWTHHLENLWSPKLTFKPQSSEVSLYRSQPPITLLVNWPPNITSQQALSFTVIYSQVQTLISHAHSSTLSAVETLHVKCHIFDSEKIVSHQSRCMEWSDTKHFAADFVRHWHCRISCSLHFFFWPAKASVFVSHSHWVWGIWQPGKSYARLNSQHPQQPLTIYQRILHKTGREVQTWPI